MMQRTVAGNANRDSAPVVFNVYREGDILPEIGISQIGTGDLVTVDQKLICEMPDLDPKPRSLLAEPRRSPHHIPGNFCAAERALRLTVPPRQIDPARSEARGAIVPSPCTTIRPLSRTRIRSGN
ncbi:MAG: hypothetical protein Q7U29_14095 [Bradyrhizobium sp.]|nr:hypothetical protein [Bradyrhizobium sp.]